MPARNALQEIYYAQRDYQANHYRWAASLGELTLSADLARGVVKAPTMRLTADGFVATAEIKLPGGRIQRWHIRQDARVWPE